MRFLYIFCFSIAFANLALSQTETQDSTIHMVVEEMPRFPGCETLDTTLQYLNACAERSLLSFVYDNVNYPAQARLEGISGTVVASFVVEKDGVMSNMSISKDIGGGCGDEVIRLLKATNEIGLRWRPGHKNGEPVRVKFNLPVKFRLQDYVFMGMDTVYTNFTEKPDFVGGESGWNSFVKDKIQYPKNYQDSCQIGHMSVEMLIRPDGSTRFIELNDYMQLGYDFWYETVALAHRSKGSWEVGKLDTRAVPTSVQKEFLFQNDKANCKISNDLYLAQYDKVQTAVKAYEQGGEAATLILTLDEAIEAYPQNLEYRYLRAQMQVGIQNMEAACEDLQIVRMGIFSPEIENLVRLVCQQTK